MALAITIADGNGYAKNVAINFQKIETVSSRKTTIPDSYGKSGQTGANGGTASTSVSATPPGSSSSSSAQSNESHASITYNLAKSAGLF